MPTEVKSLKVGDKVKITAAFGKDKDPFNQIGIITKLIPRNNGTRVTYQLYSGYKMTHCFKVDGTNIIRSSGAKILTSIEKLES